MTRGILLSEAVRRQADRVRCLSSLDFRVTAEADESLTGLVFLMRDIAQGLEEIADKISEQLTDRVALAQDGK